MFPALHTPYASLRRPASALAVLLCMLMGSLRAQGPELPQVDPSRVHTLIYKAAGKCEDTIRLTRFPHHLRFEWRSKSACTANLGFGDVFWKKSRSKLFFVQDSALYMMIAVQHKDKMLDLKRGSQQVVSPYGAYVAKLMEETQLHGRWRTWTLRIAPEGAQGAYVVLRFNAEMGIMSLQNKGAKGESLGDIQLFSIDGKPVEEFARHWRQAER